MRTGTRIVILSCIAVLALYDFGLAYKTDTHEIITIAAVSKSNNYLKFLQAFKINPAVANSLEVYGSFAEDSENRFFFHFYDPINNHGLGFPPLAFDPALLWGYRHDLPLNEYSWTKARGYMYHALTATDREGRDTNFRMLSRSLGQIVHLVEDMAQPSHVRNDPHASHYENTTGAFLVDPSRLEDWALVHPGEVLSFINSSGGPRPVDSFEDAFETLALFSNQNFFSDDTIFKDYPLPSEQETNYSDDFLPFGTGQVAKVRAEDGQVYMVPYIVKTSGVDSGYKLAQVGYFGTRIYNTQIRHLAFQIDDEVARENAEILLPKAVEYSAGLLDYFFRGEMDMVKDSGVPGHYRIANSTDEPMVGSFGLYYDDASDNRYLIKDWRLSIAANGQSDQVIFDEPTSPAPKEKGKYILVFSGTLGNEKGAVAGSVVRLSSDTPPLYLKLTLPDHTVVYWDIENDEQVDLVNRKNVTFLVSAGGPLTSSSGGYNCSGPFIPGVGRRLEIEEWGVDPGNIYLQGVTTPLGAQSLSCEGSVDSNYTGSFTEAGSSSDHLFGYGFGRAGAFVYLGVNDSSNFNKYTVYSNWSLVYGITNTFRDFKFGVYILSGDVLKWKVESSKISSWNSVLEQGASTTRTDSGSLIEIVYGAISSQTFHSTKNWAVTFYREVDAERSAITTVHVRIDIFDYNGIEYRHDEDKHLPSLASFLLSHTTGFKILEDPFSEVFVTGGVIK